MDVLVLDGEVHARAAHTGLHFVDDQERVGRAADGLRLAEVAGRSHADATLGLNGLDDKRREPPR